MVSLLIGNTKTNRRLVVATELVVIRAVRHILLLSVTDTVPCHAFNTASLYPCLIIYL